MVMDVSVGAAVLGGVLSFVSPCVLPLVPPYLCFMAGVSLDELAAAGPAGGPGVRAAGTRRRVLVAAMAFVLGFSTVFVALGATASALGALLAPWLPVLGWAAGLVIIAMGLHFLGVFRFGLMFREARLDVRLASGPAGAYVMGLAFAFGWSPCIGPVLGTILFLAGSEATAAAGARLLVAYSLGLGIPFLLAALFSTAFLRWLQRFRRHLHRVEQAMGVLLIATGVLVLTGQMARLSFWLLDRFPGLASLG
ncbi:cytochrome c biogenesis protein CcdA [Pseudoxanthobacter sp.]|uniref:cytochrome c biogenesis CcdA family protein n=1 Tax=Pseudoxanthobacter sp. TaxID=1925742 RepID=UPI002FE1A260